MKCPYLSESEELYRLLKPKTDVLRDLAAMPRLDSKATLKRYQEIYTMQGEPGAAQLKQMSASVEKSQAKIRKIYGLLEVRS